MSENKVVDEQPLTIGDITDSFFDQTVCAHCACDAIIQDLRRPKGKRDNLKEFLSFVMPAIFYVNIEDNTFENTLEAFCFEEVSQSFKLMVLSNQARLKHFGRPEGKRDWSSKILDGQGNEMEVVLYTPQKLPSVVPDKYKNSVAIKLANITANNAYWLAICYCPLNDRELSMNIWSSFLRMSHLNRHSPLQRRFTALPQVDQEDIAILIAAVFADENSADAKLQQVESLHIQAHHEHQQFPCAFKPDMHVGDSASSIMNSTSLQATSPLKAPASPDKLLVQTNAHRKRMRDDGDDLLDEDETEMLNKRNNYDINASSHTTALHEY